MAIDLYSKATTDTLLAGKLSDAPSDGSTYGRKDGAWEVVSGGGGSYLPLAGGTMTGAIVFDGTSGQYISKGNFDSSRGGNYGISLVCSIGYEFNWQAGWLTTTEQGTTTPRPLYLDSYAGTTLRVWNSGTSTGTEVTHSGITFSDTTTQTTAGIGDAPVDGFAYNRKDGAWEVAGSGGSVAWGAITGTVTDQTDLTTYLSGAYYPLSGNPSGFLTSVPAKTVNNQSGPYTLISTDAENIVNSVASSSTAIVVPQDSTYDFPVGTTIILVTNDPYNGIQSEYTGSPGYPYINNGYGGQFNGLLVTLVKIGANNWIYG